MAGDRAERESAERPRVLQVVLSLAPGGTERLVVELVRRLADQTRQAVCCLDEAGLWGEALRADGVPLQVLSRQPGFHPALAIRLARAATLVGARVLHCHQYSPFVYGALARLRRPGLRIVFTEHGRLTDAPPSTRRRLVNPLLARAAERIAAVSGELRDHMVAEGFPPSRIEVVHNGIEVGPLPSAAERAVVRSQLGVPPSALVVGTIARLDPVKDLETLLEALSSPALATREIHAIVIGDGTERERLESRAAALGMAGRLRFLGHRDDARAWLAGVDVYVNSSVSEGVSLTILEAMAAGLPVIATSVGGTPEVVTPECGRLVPARDRLRLAGALAELAADEALRRRLGGSARARVEAEFTIDRMVDRYLQMYRGNR
jgi:glycosyltransferase involved in cell wall biosynthesis